MGFYKIINELRYKHNLSLHVEDAIKDEVTVKNLVNDQCWSGDYPSVKRALKAYLDKLNSEKLLNEFDLESFLESVTND